VRWGILIGMPADLPVTRRWTIPSAELSERFSRSSGPGGQGVNTTDSRVELSFDVARSPSIPELLRQRALERLAQRLIDGVLTISASEHRAQLANRQAARERLARLLAESVVPPGPKRQRTKPTKGSQQRRLATKKRRAEVKRQRRRGDPGDA
jgi:ribosome-associated protein